MIFDGRNGGTVELLDNLLVIRRRGVASFLTQGLKGEKRIPYSSITSVQFKEAGFTTGYIQFGLAGGIESRRGVWDATTDENTVLFTKEAAEDFRRLRDIVEERAATARGGPSRSYASDATSNISEELTRLADLRDRGVLTDEEFAEQKSRLLGKAGPQANPREGPWGEHGPTSAKRPVAHPQPTAPDRTGEKRKSGIGKVFGIGCLGLFGIFVLLAAIGSEVEPTDNSTATTEPESATETASQEAAAPAELPLEVTATELFQAYEYNEASAQSYFGGRMLLVSGTVDKVTLDLMDDPVIGLRTSNQFMSAQAALAENARDEARNYGPGDQVRLLCEDVSEVIGTPMLKNCRTAPPALKGQAVQWADN